MILRIIRLKKELTPHFQLRQLPRGVLPVQRSTLHALYLCAWEAVFRLLFLYLRLSRFPWLCSNTPR